MKYFLIAICMIFAISGAQASSLLSNSDSETVDIADFISFYNQKNYTDIKKKALREKAVEMLGDRYLYVEAASVIDLRLRKFLWHDSYSLITRMTYGWNSISIVCIYSEPPPYVINLNIHDIVSITGKYDSVYIGAIYLTDCIVTP